MTLAVTMIGAKSLLMLLPCNVLARRRVEPQMRPLALLLLSHALPLACSLVAPHKSVWSSWTLPLPCARGWRCKVRHNLRGLSRLTMMPSKMITVCTAWPRPHHSLTTTCMAQSNQTWIETC